MYLKLCIQNIRVGNFLEYDLYLDARAMIYLTGA